MKRHLEQAWLGLRLFGPRQWGATVVATVVVGWGLGIVTVLIPNPVFGREIPPTVWSYPVWIVTAVLSGVLIATYVRAQAPLPVGDPTLPANDQPDEKATWWGTAGAIGSWFAIGCPVCNKIALLALGYSGALTYFGAVQPYLAGLSLILLVIAVVYRLSGTVSCAVPGRPAPIAPAATSGRS